MSMDDMKQTFEGVDLPEVVSAGHYIETEAPPERPLIRGFCEKGDKVQLVAPPKMKKSFMFLQLGISLSTGMEILGHDIPEKCRVLLVQYEIQPKYFHRRVQFISRAMGIEMADIGDRLLIVNARGKGVIIDQVSALARQHNVDVIMLDPLYKIFEGDENSNQDMAAALATFDKMVEETGAALFYVHHDCKGNAGDRNNTDRGAGGGVQSRDYDSSIILSKHNEHNGAIVVSMPVRNYPELEEFTAVWDDGCFRRDDTIPAVKETTRSKGRKKNKGKSLEEIGNAIIPLANTARHKMEFYSVMQDKLDVGRDKVRAAVGLLIDSGQLTEHSTTYPRRIWIGTPDAMIRKEAEGWK